MSEMTREELVWNLDVSQTTMKALFSDGRGNGVVIQNEETKQLFVSGLVWAGSEPMFYLVPIDDEIPLPKTLKVGDRVELAKDIVETHNPSRSLQ